MNCKLSSMVRVTLASLAFGVFAASLAQGGGGGFQRGGMGMGMNTDPLRLAFRADVQRDLGVSADQKAKLDALRSEAGGRGAPGAGGGRGGAGGGGGNVDREAMRAEMEKRRAENLKKLEGILNANQMKRLREIGIQLRGNRAVLDPQVQKDLGLSEEQKTRINSLMETFQQGVRAMMEEMRGGGGDMQAMRERMQKNNAALDAELGKILTGEQTGKLKAMGGKEFKADPPPGIG